MVVNYPRHQILARTGFAPKKQSRIGIQGGLHLLEKPDHWLASADEPPPVVLLDQFGPGGFLPLNCPLHLELEEEVVLLQGIPFHVVKSSHMQGRGHRVVIGVGSDHDHRNALIHPLDFFQNSEALIVRLFHRTQKLGLIIFGEALVQKDQTVVFFLQFLRKIYPVFDMVIFEPI